MLDFLFYWLFAFIFIKGLIFTTTSIWLFYKGEDRASIIITFLIVLVLATPLGFYIYQVNQ